MLPVVCPALVAAGTAVEMTLSRAGGARRRHHDVAWHGRAPHPSSGSSASDERVPAQARRAAALRQGVQGH